MELKYYSYYKRFFDCRLQACRTLTKINSVTAVFQLRPKSRRLIALLLPLTFFWGWAACTLLCGEISEHIEEQRSSVNAQTGEKCLIAFDIDRCPVTKTGAVVEARQTFISHALAVRNIVSRAPHEAFVGRTYIYPAEINQHSPPRSSSDPPIFLKFCAFRI